MILRWCESGKGISTEDILEKISHTSSVEELISLYKMFPTFQESLKPEFMKRKRELLLLSANDRPKPTFNHTQNQANGTH